MSSEAMLKIKDLHFSYGASVVLRSINFEVGKGESIALIGPSGQGKTTLLRLIAGDMMPVSGTIEKKGLWRRVFQSNALLPWLTVEENIKLGLRGIAPDMALDFQKVISILGLSRALKFYPRQLSGGLAQRTELARALIGRPDGLLLDEPFSSLDYLIRHETRNYLAELLKEFPISMVLVTHDIPEAVSFTQRSLVMNGRPATIVKEYDNDKDQSGLVETIWKDLRFHEEVL